jgi:hypothetical protein
LEIGEAAGHLQSWAPVTVEQLEENQQLRWAVERGLQIAAEALFDAGAHILSAEFQEIVDEYRQIPKRPLARGVLSPTTASRLNDDCPRHCQGLARTAGATNGSVCKRPAVSINSCCACDARQASSAANCAGRRWPGRGAAGYKRRRARRGAQG